MGKREKSVILRDRIDIMKIVIVGASSGIGRVLALKYAERGDMVGITGRRMELLNSIKSEYSDKIFAVEDDVTGDKTEESLKELISQMGGMDRLIYCAGYGKSNKEMDATKEFRAVEVNVKGYQRVVLFAFNYFEHIGTGHIAVIASVAGVRSLGTAPAYSATKQFEITYHEALQKVARIRGSKIKFTTIMPGFIDTDFLSGNYYPMKMGLDYAARRIFKAIDRQKRKAVIDWRWHIIVCLWRFIPGWLWVRLKI